MKKLPMILLLTVPYAMLIVCAVAGVDMFIGLCAYGALLVFNMVYAFLMPKLGFNGRQILFWNLLLKLCQIPLCLLILVFTLVIAMVGGEATPAMVLFALAVCYLMQLSSSVFGFSGLRWFRKYGKLSKVSAAFGRIAQWIPLIDVLGAILCYSLLRKETTD